MQQFNFLIIVVCIETLMGKENHPILSQMYL